MNFKNELITTEGATAEEAIQKMREKVGAKPAMSGGKTEEKKAEPSSDLSPRAQLETLKPGEQIQIGKLKVERLSYGDKPLFRIPGMAVGPANYTVDAILKEAGIKDDRKAESPKVVANKIPASLKEKIDKLTPTEKFKVVNDELGLWVFAGDKNFRADKDGGTERLLAHAGAKDITNEKIEQAVDKVLARREAAEKRLGTDLGKKEEKSEAAKAASPKHEDLSKRHRSSFFKVKAPFDVWALSGHKKSSDFVGSSRVYKGKYEKIEVRPGDEIHALPGGIFLVGKDGRTASISSKEPEDKSIYERGKSTSDVFDMSKLEEVDRSKATKPSSYEYELKPAAAKDSKPVEPKKSLYDKTKFTGKEKEQPGTTWEERFPHIKDFLEQAEDTRHLGQLKKQAYKWMMDNDSWKAGPIDKFAKDHAETLRMLGRSGHKQTTMAEHRMDTLLRTRDSSGKATPRKF